MKKRLLSVLLCVAMTAAMVIGCGAKEEKKDDSANTKSGSEDKGGKIYLLHKGLDYYAWAAMQEAFDKYAGDLDCDYEILNAENDVSKQVEQFKTVLTQNPKAIIVTAIDSESLIDCVKEANDADIPIGVYDTPITGGDIDITVDCDNLMAGQQAAEIIVDKLKEKNGEEKGKVLNVFGDLASQVMQERKQGFDDVMEKYPNIEVIEASGKGDRLLSQDAASNALAANEDIDAVHAPCDNAFYGVYEAVEAAGKLKKVGEDGHIIMVSLDGEPAALDRISEGYMDGTVNLDWHAVAAICLEMMDKYIFEGKDLPDTYEAKDSYFKFSWDSTEIKDATEWKGPWISLPTHKIDKDNAQDPNNSGRYSADVLGIEY
ncbi:sugar ABC transporter substrate-binding protein [Clostridium sp. AF15-17LB]|nr:sugar ABC transporter substrate-binding protein [Clostridium sp. AF15-17LB]